MNWAVRLPVLVAIGLAIGVVIGAILGMLPTAAIYVGALLVFVFEVARLLRRRKRRRRDHDA